MLAHLKNGRSGKGYIPSLGECKVGYSKLCEIRIAQTKRATNSLTEEVIVHLEIAQKGVFCIKGKGLSVLK